MNSEVSFFCNILLIGHIFSKPIGRKSKVRVTKLKMRFY